MNRIGRGLLLIIGLAGAAEGGDASFGGGAMATVGSGGYTKFAFDADGLWHGENVDPYGWAGFSSDNFVRQFSLGAGVWKNLRDDLRVKGGGGLIFGRLKDSDTSAQSLLLETGMEMDSERAILGAGYTLISGSIVGPSESRATAERANQRARGAASGRTEPERLTDHELAGYAKLPLGRVMPGFRLALVLPSYSRPIVVETLSCKIRVLPPFSLTPAVSFEEGAANNAYFSLGLYYLF